MILVRLRPMPFRRRRLPGWVCSGRPSGGGGCRNYPSLRIALGRPGGRLPARAHRRRGQADPGGRARGLARPPGRGRAQDPRGHAVPIRLRSAAVPGGDRTFDRTLLLRSGPGCGHAFRGGFSRPLPVVERLPTSRTGPRLRNRSFGRLHKRPANAGPVGGPAAVNWNPRGSPAAASSAIHPARPVIGMSSIPTGLKEEAPDECWPPSARSVNPRSHPARGRIADHCRAWYSNRFWIE